MSQFKTKIYLYVGMQTTCSDLPYRAHDESETAMQSKLSCVYYKNRWPDTLHTS